MDDPFLLHCQNTVSHISTNVCGWSEKKVHHNVHTLLLVSVTSELTGQQHVLGKTRLNTDLHHRKELCFQLDGQLNYQKKMRNNNYI